MKENHYFKNIIIIILSVIVQSSCSGDDWIKEDCDIAEYSTYSSGAITRSSDAPLPKQGNIMGGSKIINLPLFTCTLSWPTVTVSEGNYSHKKPSASISPKDGHPEVYLCQYDVSCSAQWPDYRISYTIRYDYFQGVLDSYGRWEYPGVLLQDSISGSYYIEDQYIY